MEEKQRNNWTREETILAFDLYCKIPFAKISKTNEDIIALAKILGRTPSAVGLKMSNLAHFDPELQARSIKGMSHGSKQDAMIWAEFSSDWEKLSFEAQRLLAEKKNITVDQVLESVVIENIPSGRDREQVMKTRVGQYFFRQSVLSAYGSRCCVTGLATPELLVASHIKPWKDSDERTERTNPHNGLCLNALHDKAFDRGLITLDAGYRIILSKKLCDASMDKETEEWLKSYDKKQIILPDKFMPGREFIEYHNDVVFLR